MNRFQKLLALILTAVMICAAGSTAFAMSKEEYAAAAKIETTLADDYTGKTVILHSNDVHGAIAGYAYIAGLKNAFESKGAEVILADAGDFSQGTPYVSTTKGSSAIAMMVVAGYDVVTLGNHEFDYGYPQLMDNIAAVTNPELENKIKFICADILLKETGEAIIDCHTVIETEGGLKLGFFGMDTPETATKVNPAVIDEISFMNAEEMAACAQNEIDELKAEGADLVIGLIHLGVDVESTSKGNGSTNLYANVSGVDFLIDGHSHTVMTAGENGEPIQSTGLNFANVGVVVIDNETKAIEDNFLMPVQNGVYEMTKDAETAAWAQTLIDATDEVYSAVFATSEVLLNGDRAPGNRTQETNLGDLIADAMVWSVVKEGGIEQEEKNVVGITNGGGIRAPISEGDVSMLNINTVLPFGNTVAVVYVTGAELLEALEASPTARPIPSAAIRRPAASPGRWTPPRPSTRARLIRIPPTSRPLPSSA